MEDMYMEYIAIVKRLLVNYLRDGTHVMDVINDFVINTSKLLSIFPPKIVLDESHSANYAHRSEDCTEIALYENCELVDALFAIAHELRHVWQMRIGGSYFAEESIADIDANAFAVLVMLKTVGEPQQIDGFSESEKEKIQERMNEIKWF